MLSRVISCGILGIDGYRVDVEVDISSGLPTFNIVGLPDTAVKEGRDRIRASLKNSGFELPQKRITVNLAPSDIKKEGGLYDLPIAIGILAAFEVVPQKRIENFCFIGELSLDGRLNRTKGVLVSAFWAKENGFSIVVPKENANESSISGAKTYSFSTFGEVVAFLRGEREVEQDKFEISYKQKEYEIDFADIKGQESIKRMIEVAAAGGHNVLMIGPPGAGKTLISRAIPSILPRLLYDEMIEVTKIYSVSGLLRDTVVTNRPFRNPHHTISDAALIGGGTIPKPGEISLAHCGVLFLDELPEFKRNVLESLRTPMDSGTVTISRTQRTVEFPARAQIVAAMNPCPCGYFGDPKRECRCSYNQIRKYLSKVSGPFLDRIDIHIEVPSLTPEEFFGKGESESSQKIRTRVEEARKVQENRYRDEKVKLNANMSPSMIKKYCKLSSTAQKVLEEAMRRRYLSARAVSKVLKLSMTISDLEGKNSIETEHILESLNMRKLEKYYATFVAAPSL